jgi:glycogen synthase
MPLMSGGGGPRPSAAHPEVPHRLLMTADAVGGVWNYSLTLARELGEVGVEVVLALMGPAPDSAKWDEARALPTVTVHAAPFRLEWMDDPWLDVSAAGEWLLDLERRYAPEIVHLNGYAHGALPFRAPKLVVGHSCVYSWWRAVRGCVPPASVWDTYHRCVTAGLTGAHAIAAPTQFMLSSLRDNYPFVEAHAFVINNGRTTAPVVAAAKEPFVFFAGRLWDEAKNVAVLLDAAPAIPWPVIVAGEVNPPGSAHGGEDATTSSAVPRNVRFTGQLSAPRIADALARASIFVSPARYEPFGLSVLEAASSGCALVLADIPSFRELWDGAAVFFPTDDRDRLIDATGELIRDPAARLAAGKRAHERSRQYSATRMRDEYLGLYRALAGRAAHDRFSDGDAFAAGGVPCES